MFEIMTANTSLFTKVTFIPGQHIAIVHESEKLDPPIVQRFRCDDFHLSIFVFSPYTPVSSMNGGFDLLIKVYRPKGLISSRNKAYN